MRQSDRTTNQRYELPPPDMICHRHKYHLPAPLSCLTCEASDDGVCYTSCMAKETTLNEIGAMLAHVVKHMATKDDIADISRDMATKDQIIALHTQVNSIETQLRGMQHVKLQSRVADLEEEVFGKSRA